MDSKGTAIGGRSELKQDCWRHISDEASAPGQPVARAQRGGWAAISDGPSPLHSAYSFVRDGLSATPAWLGFDVRESSQLTFKGPCGIASRMTLTAVLTPAEEGGFVALNPETGTTSQGESVEEAVANLREATELYLEEFPIPAAGKPLLTTFEVAARA